MKKNKNKALQKKSLKKSKKDSKRKQTSSNQAGATPQTVFKGHSLGKIAFGTVTAVSLIMSPESGFGLGSGAAPATGTGSAVP